MPGKRKNSRSIRALVGRWSVTLWTIVVGLSATSFLVYVIVDSVKTAQVKDRIVQEAKLSEQLAEFLLATRDPDGSSLLENTLDFSQANHPLRIVTLKRSFFGYFLRRSNAREFTVEDIDWEAPRACVSEIANNLPNREDDTNVMQACFATVRRDLTGNFVYFGLKFPTSTITRHSIGKPLTESDYVVVNFVGDQQVSIQLAFETAQLATSRYPSQLRRFRNVHGVSGYIVGSGGKSSRLINAQAIEKTVSGTAGEGRSDVTIRGRIDIAVLRKQAVDTLDWPARTLSTMKIGIDVFKYDAKSGKAIRQFSAPVGADSTALASLEGAYLSSVPSRGVLKVQTMDRSGVPQTVWDSTTLTRVQPQTLDWTQRLSNWLAPQLAALFGNPAQPVLVQQTHAISGLPPITATLSLNEPILPDIAARAQMWLVVVLVVTIVVYVLWIRSIYRLQSITSAAYTSTVSPLSDNKILSQNSNRRDEIGTLAKVLDLLIRRNRSRNSIALRRAKMESLSRLVEVRRQHEHLRTRLAILDAIGHEIRSPLQSLLNRSSNDSELHTGLLRMQNAVEALYFSATVEDGIKNGNIVLTKQDLADFIFRFAQNSNEEHGCIEYVGPTSSVLSHFDEIVLSQILDSVLENSLRYRTPQTSIEMGLRFDDTAAFVSISNHGPPISFSDIDSIFTFGVSDHIGPKHKGQGLFTARTRVLAMNGAIAAQNVEGGVEFVITFPVVEAHN